MRDTPIDVAASYATFETAGGYTQVHCGVSMWKTVDDLARYRRVVEGTRPEVVVETGTRWGGFAAWLADTFGVQVITVDITAPPEPACRWAGVTVVTGSSVDDAVVTRVMDLVAGRRCMVVLDSDHHAPHVQAEVAAYGPMVTSGCYLVVEDGLADLLDPPKAARFGRRIPDEGGPLAAIEVELSDAPEWERDLDVEGMSPVSHHPFGWWRRV